MRRWLWIVLLLSACTKQAPIEPVGDPDITLEKTFVAEKLDDIGEKYTKYTIVNHIYSLKIKRPLRMTVIHNSASPGKLDLGLATVKMFKDWHVNHRGWATIGYHWVISTDGTIYAGRKMELMGAHAGPGNEGSVGVCLVGNLEDYDEPTEAQKEAFAALHVALRNKFYGFTKDIVHFHREFMQTACPGKITIDRVNEWVRRYEEKRPTSQRPRIVINGKEIGSGYLFNEETFIRVRDLENAGFVIGWDNQKKTVLIIRPNH